MGWKGIVIGGYLGSMLGPLGAILGAALGHSIEKKMGGDSSGAHSRRRETRSASAAEVFCASAAAMLAKMAKSDGRVREEEIAVVESAFERLGFNLAARRYAVEVFRRAKDDSHSIYEYAREFAEAVPSVEVRELFYGMLWELARADGTVSAEEREILRRIPASLGIGQAWYSVHDDPDPAAAHSSLSDAYAALGVSASASDEEIRRVYREKAKKYHPDALRAQGLPEEMISRAAEQMKKVNAAWSAIRSARGM